MSFVGAVDDIRPYLAAADVVVLPSYREGHPPGGHGGRRWRAGRWWPTTCGACGRSSTPAPGSSCPGATVRRSATVVEALLDDPERRATLGKACRARVLEQFSEDAVIARLRGVYAELAAAA